MTNRNTPAERATTNQASRALAGRLAEARELIAAIEGQMARREFAATAGTADWGDVGDMGYAVELLRRLAGPDAAIPITNLTCPGCGENRIDRLEWILDAPAGEADALRCCRCATTYRAE